MSWRTDEITIMAMAMDDETFDDLPRAYRLGLRLRALGADDQLIADCLEVDAGAIVTLLDIGARKLQRIQDATGPACP